MSALTNKHFFPRTSVTKTACRSLRLIAIGATLLLTMMPLLTGCGEDSGGGEGQVSTPAAAKITKALAWQPVEDPSIHAYFVHYGRQSPGQDGSCAYESSLRVTSPSATVPNLEPNTRYYFAVSAYNGEESLCSEEVSIVTPPASIETDRRSPSHAPLAMLNTTASSGAPLLAKLSA